MVSFLDTCSPVLLIPAMEQGGWHGSGEAAVPCCAPAPLGMYFCTAPFLVNHRAAAALLSLPSVESPQGPEQHGSNT